MIRGTTAQFRFKIPCVKGRLTSAIIKFWQVGNPGSILAPLPITKKLSHCTAFETDERKNINKWNSNEYEDIKADLNLLDKTWDSLTEDEKKQFASATFNEICISLTAEETLRFSDKTKANVQLRARRKDGATFASRQQLITVYPINDDIVIEDPTLPDEDGGFIILDGGPIVNRGGDNQ
jgi:hypothetical protein